MFIGLRLTPGQYRCTGCSARMRLLDAEADAPERCDECGENAWERLSREEAPPVLRKVPFDNAK